MKKHYSFTLVSLVVMVVALGVLLRPLIQSGFYISDDGEWMIIRLSAFYQSLASGQFPVRFLGRLNNSYGYPVANFLYPGFLYIGSILRLMGASFVDTIKIILGASVVGSTIVLFASLRTRFKPLPSVMGALSFIFAPYLLFDLYHRGSVGEVLAIFFFSLAYYAIVRGLGWLLAGAIGLLIISHNTVALIAGVAIFCLILLRKDRLRLLFSFVLGIGMAAFFWLPALAEKRFVRFDAVSVSNPLAYFIGMKDAWLLGIATVIALMLVLGRRMKLEAHDKAVIGLVSAGFVLSLPLSMFLWQTRIVASLVQFPYRFLVLPTVLGPWVVALAIQRLYGMRLALLSGVFVVLWIMVALAQLQKVESVYRPEVYYSTNEATTNVANEYMPVWVSDVPTSRPVETLELMSGDAILSGRTFIGETFTVDIEAKETSIIQINKIYYPGWGVAIDGSLVPIDYRNALGVMRVTVPQGTHKLVAAFRETPLRFAADIVSVISVLSFFFLIRRLNKSV